MICISIQEKQREVATALAERADMAEIRIDLGGYTAKDVAYIFSSADCLLVATCRTNEEISSTSQITLLTTAIEAGANYVDIDISDDPDVKKAVLDCAKENDCQIIVSYHNYENTPPTNTLEQIIDDCFDAGADIAKVVTTAENSQDCARVLSLYQTKRALVAFAMGEIGKITRVACLKLGSPFSYAAQSEEHVTAPGQLTAEQMAIYLNI